MTQLMTLIIDGDDGVVLWGVNKITNQVTNNIIVILLIDISFNYLEFPIQKDIQFKLL